MTVPSIGEPRGILEIFVPGLFLLTNGILAAYFLPGNDASAKAVIDHITASAGLSFIVAIAMGYCLGVALRLLRTSSADRWSGFCLRLLGRLPFFHRSARFAIKGDKFPYPRIFARRVEELPEPAQVVYRDTWCPRPGQVPPLQHFDLLKQFISTIDERAAKEMYAAEALCRYVANSFYAILASLGAVTTTLVLRHTTPLIALTAPAVIYFLALLVISFNFRFLRMYEAETVFALAYRYHTTLQPLLHLAPNEPLPN